MSQKDINKAAAIETMKAARKAHDGVGACLNGYCDHGDTQKCMEKAAEAHKAIQAAFADQDETDTEKALRKLKGDLAVAKLTEIKKDDPDALRKAASAVLSGGETLID